MTDFHYFYTQACTFPMFPVHGTHQEQEAFSTKHANSIIKIRLMNAAHKAHKEEKGVKKIGSIQEYVPKVATKCQAVNLNNSTCKFKATCGKFCKKHQVTVEMLELII